MQKRKKGVNPLFFIVPALILLALVLNFIPSKTTQLSELQTTACNVAHDSGNCGSRLSEVGIVLKDECCQALGKCCS